LYYFGQILGGEAVTAPEGKTNKLVVDWKKVREIAYRVRRWVETFRKEQMANSIVHYDYSLAGLCAIATARLYRELKQEGIHGQIWSNSYHCFLTVNNKVVDVTATQFGRERVVITPTEYSDGFAYWKRERASVDGEALYARQVAEDWPMPQRAKPEYVDFSA
jgi:hypothetical protein